MSYENVVRVSGCIRGGLNQCSDDKHLLIFGEPKVVCYWEKFRRETILLDPFFLLLLE